MKTDMILIKIRKDGHVYGDFVLKKGEILKYDPSECKSSKRKCLLSLDAAFVHYLIREFHLSRLYCDRFVTNFYKEVASCTNTIKLTLQPTQRDLIDYNWNDRIALLVWERCELDHMFSWLSTLGGAFSALGDYFSSCALMAGKISYHQLQLGMRLGDPNLAARCKLYFSLSLVQRCYFKLAKQIIYKEYTTAKNASIIDERLLNMCKGIWSKLQYEKYLYKTKQKKQNNKHC